MSVLIAVALFVVEAALAVWATERLVEGLASLATALRLSVFAGAALSGFEARNVAVRVAAGASGTAPVTLGTVSGGATFLVCVALGLDALPFPFDVRLPRPSAGPTFSWRSCRRPP
jgi:Ca2+/Na+ antiporter